MLIDLSFLVALVIRTSPKTRPGTSRHNTRIGVHDGVHVARRGVVVVRVDDRRQDGVLQYVLGFLIIVRGGGSTGEDHAVRDQRVVVLVDYYASVLHKLHLQHSSIDDVSLPRAFEPPLIPAPASFHVTSSGRSPVPLYRKTRATRPWSWIEGYLGFNNRTEDRRKRSQLIN